MAEFPFIPADSELEVVSLKNGELLLKIKKGVAEEHEDSEVKVGLKGIYFVHGSFNEGVEEVKLIPVSELPEHITAHVQDNLEKLGYKALMYISSWNNSKNYIVFKDFEVL